jgi:hypothetical protein
MNISSIIILATIRYFERNQLTLLKKIIVAQAVVNSLGLKCIFLVADSKHIYKMSSGVGQMKQPNSIGDVGTISICWVKVILLE